MNRPMHTQGGGCAHSRGLLGPIIGLTLLAAVTTSVAGGLELQRFTIDAGGGRSTSMNLDLTGTTAQPEAAQQEATGGPLTLRGGFWRARSADLLFRDDFEGGPAR